MSQLRRDFSAFIKDGLRGARHEIRRRWHGADATRDPLRRGLGEVAGLADNLLTSLERTAVTFGRPDMSSPDALLRLYAELPRISDPSDFLGAFAKAQYRLVLLVLEKHGARNVFVSEHDIVGAARKLAGEGLHRRASGGDADQSRMLAFATESVLQLSALRPVRSFEGGNASLQTDADAFAFTVVALAGCVYALNKSGPIGGASLCLRSAAAVVEARLERFRRAWHQPEPGSLRAEFEAVLPFLP